MRGEDVSRGGGLASPAIFSEHISLGGLFSSAISSLAKAMTTPYEPGLINMTTW